MFKSYWKACRANKITDTRLQHDFLTALLDSKLRYKLKRRMLDTDNTPPVFGVAPDAVNEAVPEVGSLIYYLRNEFKVLHPIRSRQLNMLQFHPQPGQTWSNFFHKWFEQWTCSGMEALTHAQLGVLLLMSHTTEAQYPDLLKKFQELTDPTFEDLLDAAQTYEAHDKERRRMAESYPVQSMRGGSSSSEPMRKRYRMMRTMLPASRMLRVHGE